MHRARALAQLSALLRDQCPRKPDWPAVLAMAGEHLIVAQLRPHLPDDHRTPADVRAYVEEMSARTRARNLRLNETLSHALDAMNARDLEPVLLKGCAQWAEAPAGLSDRVVADIDLFVEPDAAGLAIEALENAGFDLLEDHRDAHDHQVVVLGRKGDVGAIDLHFRLPGAALIDGLAELCLEARTVRLDGARARTLTPELQIFILAMHDQIHDAHLWRGGFDLRRLIDTARLARSNLQWDRLSALATTPLAQTALAAYVQAAYRLAGAQIPPQMRTGLSEFHYLRQRAQYCWPQLSAAFDHIRERPGIGRAQHRLWAALLAKPSRRDRGA